MRDRTRYDQAGRDVEFPVRQDQSWPVLGLLPTGLRLEVDPGQVTAVRQILAARHLPDFFADGLTPTDLSRLVVWAESLDNILERQPFRPMRLNHEPTSFHLDIDLRPFTQPKLLEQRLRQSQPDAVPPTMQCSRHDPVPGRASIQ
jgi:hypothetical protein